MKIRAAILEEIGARAAVRDLAKGDHVVLVFVPSSGCPTRIAQLRGFFGGPDDIDKQNRGERLIGMVQWLAGAAAAANGTEQIAICAARSA